MSFMERYLNTIATAATVMIREYMMLPEAVATLDKHFPGEKRSSLEDLEKTTSLVLQFGHPLLGDGWKPTMPNFVQIGKL